MPTLRVAFLGVLLLSAAAAVRPGASERRFVIEEATIGQVQTAFETGDLTCRALVDGYLARIEKFDQQGPVLNAIASVNPDAVAEADRLDREFAAMGLTGPLHCVPVIVKENIETKGWETTGGSIALAGFIPDRDATAIARLKAAGAIILAKANMADLALNALTTANKIRGTTKNPYALDRVPAGSSGGTAVALAANFGLVGLGTDTGNSVRGPAAHASLVGMRPTMGLTSRTGMIPLEVMSDVIGPMARTVEDVATVLDVLVGVDPADPSTEALRELSSVPQMVTAMDEGLEGLRVGVLRQAYLGGPLQIDPQVARVFGRAMADLMSLGVTVIDPVSVEMVAFPAIADRCRGLKYDLNEYLAQQGEKVQVHSLEQIIAAGDYDPSVEADLLAMAAVPSEGPGSKACEASLAYRAAWAKTITKLMDKEKLDALVYPTWSQLPQLTDHIVSQDAGQSLRFATAAGFPALTVPMGFSTEGLPLGVSFMGRAWSDATLVELAYGYEQATRHRRPPVLAPPIRRIPEVLTPPAGR